MPIKMSQQQNNHHEHHHDHHHEHHQLHEEMEEMNLNDDAASVVKTVAKGSSDRIEIELKIPSVEMARQLMYKTIEILQNNADTTTNADDREQALHCIELIKRDNAALILPEKSKVI